MGQSGQAHTRVHTHTHNMYIDLLFPQHTTTSESVNFILPRLLTDARSRQESSKPTVSSISFCLPTSQFLSTPIRKAENKLKWKNLTSPFYHLITSSPEDLLVTVFLGPVHIFRWLSVWSQFHNKAISPTPQVYMVRWYGLIQPTYQRLLKPWFERGISKDESTNQIFIDLLFKWVIAKWTTHFHTYKDFLVSGCKHFKIPLKAEVLRFRSS